MAQKQGANYRALDPDKIVATLDTLTARIGERFPGAGLNNVASQLLDVAYRTEHNASTLERPIWSTESTRSRTLLARQSSIRSTLAANGGSKLAPGLGCR